MRPSVDEHKTSAQAHVALEEVEDKGQPWMLTMTEAKLLGIAGIGFFLDGMCIFAPLALGAFATYLN